MRPRDPKLRVKYRESVARLKAAHIPVSFAAVASDLLISLHTVRNFFYRNPVLGRKLGLDPRSHCTAMEYIEAAKAIDLQCKRITVYSMGKLLNRDHSAVSRFIRNHPDIRARIYEDTGCIVGWGKTPELVVPKKVPGFLTKQQTQRAP